MKKFYTTIIIGLALLMGSCSDFTEIDPKGKNVLNRVEDLNLLLNYEYYLRIDNKQSTLINDFFPSILANVPNLLTESIRTLNGVYVSWDENANRAELVETDDTYTELYSIIGKVANPVLLNVDAAAGDRTMADRLKAEALVLRAWCHYLLVNIYAKAYTPETAATDPGIVYALETDAVEIPNEKLTVGQVYELILADINAALELGSLPTNPADMRIGLPFAYAVKAKVLMSMRNYEGAFAAAGESLKLNSTIDDYNEYLQMNDSYGLTEFVRPYFALEEELFASPYSLILCVMTRELWDTFEEGHILKDYLLTDEKLFGIPTMGIMYLGLSVPVVYASNVYYSPLGLTTVDMYLTQAECYIREGNVDDAMDLLNQIRIKRIVPEKYADKTVASAEEAFAIMKNISRTENFATLKNFINLRRWNTEPAYQKTITKTIEWDVNVYDDAGNVTGTEHRTWSGELAPDSPLWIFPFPQNATTFNPNLTQNYETNN